MDIEKLIERLYCPQIHSCPMDGEYPSCSACQKMLVEDIATSLSTLRAENEQLRAELEQKSKLLAQQAAELERRDKLLKEQETELERVKRERSAAVDDLETIMFVGGQNTDTCMYCKNARCYDRGGSQLCSPQWRGQRKEN